MKRTCRLYEHERYAFADGDVLERDEVTVEPFGKTAEGRTVWADIDDDSCLYTLAAGLLWRFDGEVW